MHKTNRKISRVKSRDLDSNWIVAEYYLPEYLDLEQKIKNNFNKKLKFKQIAGITRVTGFEVEKYLKIVDEGVNYLRVKNVNDCFIDYTDMQHIPNDVHQIFQKSQYSHNDIALTITGRVGSAAIITDNKQDYNSCQDVVKVSIKNKKSIDPYYLTVYLNSEPNGRLLKRFNSGGSRPRTLINNVRDVKIPIPPLEIQKYIGDKVRKAEQMRKDADRFKNEAEEIFNKELHVKKYLNTTKKFEDKFTFVKSIDLKTRIDSEYYKNEFIYYEQMLKGIGVQKVYLKDIAKSIKTGTTPKAKYLTVETQDIYFIRVENVIANMINLNNILHIINASDLRLKFIYKNDILVTIAGTIGRSAVLNYDRCTINQNVAAITINKNQGILPHYLAFFFNSILGKMSLERASTQATIKYINNEILKSVEIPMIRMEKQVAIENLINKWALITNNSKQLIHEAKQDVEDLIEGNFDMSKLDKIEKEAE